MSTDVCLTGFGQFCGVPENPTSTLMRQLPAYLAEQLDGSIHISSCNILETSRHCIPVLLDLKHDLSVADRKIFLHLGVATRNETFALEDRAYNEADFRVPDESGWQPRGVLIADAHDAPTFHHRTRFDLNFLCQTLTALNHHVCVSKSAGRFICNYVYFHSLDRAAHADEANVPLSLFVHVPSFETIPEAQQMLFIRDLIRLLASCPVSDRPPQQEEVSAAMELAAKQAVE